MGIWESLTMQSFVISCVVQVILITTVSSKSASFEFEFATYLQARSVVIFGPENDASELWQFQTQNFWGLYASFSVTKSHLVQVLNGSRNVSTLVVMYGPSQEIFKALHLKYPSSSWLLQNEEVNATRSGEYGLRLDSRLFTFCHQDNDKSKSSIFEYYAIKKGPLINQKVGHWTATNGLRILEPNMWERRSNLRGIELVNIMLEWAPFNIEGSNNTWNGILADLASILSNATNFKVLNI